MRPDSGTAQQPEYLGQFARIAGRFRGQGEGLGPGSLMHDLGKGIDLEYFEDGAPYDGAKVRQPPVLGSGRFKRRYGQRYEDAR